MKIGSLVECITNFSNAFEIKSGLVICPVQHDLYIIRDIKECKPENDIGVHLEEIVNNKNNHGIEFFYSIHGFKEVQPPMKIDIEELMTELV